MEDRLRKDELCAAFADKTKISRPALKQFYHQYYPELKETTFRWMLYELKQKRLLYSVDRGVFSLQGSPLLPEYSPLVSKPLQVLYPKVQKQFPFISVCLWETSSLNSFLLHQLGKGMTIVEVDPDAAEAVFYHLKTNHSNVYLTPTQQELERYVYTATGSIVIKKLVSQSPVRKQGGIPTPKLEKILVDLFADIEFYYPYQGKERDSLFQNAFDRFRLSLKTLYRYAGRRKCRNEFESYLNQLGLPDSGKERTTQ